jgi:hypothetical protein
MAKPNFQYEKRQRDLEKKKKKEEKKQRKLEKSNVAPEENTDQSGEESPENIPAGGEAT